MKVHKLVSLCVGTLLAMLSTALIAQTCRDGIIPTAPDSRFQNNGDGTVSDLQTGLMWQHCSVGQSGDDCETGAISNFTWDLALQYPASVNSSGGFAGHSDWRLPNRNELVSLVEEACVSPAINQTLFPNTPSAIFWTSSPYGGADSLSATNNWIVDFEFGRSNVFTFRDESYNVRLVRSE